MVYTAVYHVLACHDLPPVSGLTAAVLLKYKA